MAFVADREVERYLIYAIIAIAALILLVLLSRNSPFRSMAPGETANYKKVEEYNSGRPSECRREGWKIVTDRSGRVVGVRPG